MRSSNKQLITYCSHAQPSGAYSVHAMQAIKQYIQPRNTVKQSVTRCNQSVTQSPGHAFTQQFAHSVAQTHTCSQIIPHTHAVNTLSLASARVHRDGRHMHGGVEPESTQHFSMRAQPINHPHLDCSQSPSAVTVVIRFYRAEMIAQKYLWWRTPLVLFRDH